MDTKREALNSKNKVSIIVKHRRGKRNSVKVKTQLFCAIGVNVNGIKGKWCTLKML